MTPRLDVLLVALIALGVIVAGVCGVLERPVPDLVEYVVIGCLAAVGVRGRREERDHAIDT